jgi:hypothetical protein
VSCTGVRPWWNTVCSAWRFGAAGGQLDGGQRSARDLEGDQSPWKERPCEPLATAAHGTYSMVE